MPALEVKSHVARDLVQSAQLFKTDKAVVWEYVANGLQYTTPGVPPKVIVNVDEKQKMIRVTDNGRGMTLADLQHFFTMHGENKDRAAGRIGRGMFGTGKSAAFAIGTSLRISTIRDGKRTVAELTRDLIDNMTSGAEIPVRLVETESLTGEANGTTVTIGGIHLKRIDRAGIIQNIERHLARYPKDVEVIVDHHLCEYKLPEVAEEYEYFADGDDQKLLRNARLVIRVSRGPLDEESRGVSVFSHGNWHATTLAGSENKPMAEYLFGEIEVPSIDDYKSRVPAYDSSRSGLLNPNNEVVAALNRFVGPKIDTVRRHLVSRERERAKSEEAKKLAQQAAQIAQILASDFSAFQVKIARVQSATRGRDSGSAFSLGRADGERMVEGGQEIAELVTQHKKRRSRRDVHGADGPDFRPPVTLNETGETTGERRGSGEGRQRTPQGGFNVEYQNAGGDERRGKYISDRRTIVINLDHPQVDTAMRSHGIEHSSFMRLAVEIAISEYAIALAEELIDQYGVPDEPLFDIRDTIDRISRRFASVYA